MAEIVIGDEKLNTDLLFPQEFGRGLDLSLKGEAGYGDAATGFPDELLIPRSEWQARIEEKEERHSRLSDLRSLYGHRTKNQKQTSMCWSFGTVTCCELRRLAQGEPLISLSPASVAGPVKNYRDPGGWGLDAIRYIAKNGIVPSAHWPDAENNRKYATTVNKAMALNFRFTEWHALRPRSVEQTVSCLLRNIPVAAGYNWWRHLVALLDVLWLDGAPAIRFLNSWGEQFGEQGYGILRGQRMLPDDAVCPRVAIGG